MFNANGYNTNAAELNAVAPTTLKPGTAVKLVGLPVSMASPYYQVAAAGPTDTPVATVSQKGDVGTSPGKIVQPKGWFPVRMVGAGDKDAFIKVSTMDGGWDVAAAGEVARGQLVEAAGAGELQWAQPVGQYTV